MVETTRTVPEAAGLWDLPARDNRERAGTVFALLRGETEDKIEPNLESPEIT